MRCWPKTRKPLIKRIHADVSRWVIDFAASLPDCQRGPLHMLQTLAKHESPRDHDLTACPEGLKFSLLEVTYSDLVFLEDFSRLASGIVDLIRLYGRGVPIRETEDILRWFEQMQTNPRGGSCLNIGHLDFTCKRRGSIPLLVKSADVQIFHVAPSAISLVITVFPSQDFIKKLNALLSTNARSDTVIMNFDVRRFRITGWGSISAQQVRYRELRELFLRLNKEIVCLIRRHIGVGMAMLGPLPSLEVFTTEGSSTTQSVSTNASQSDSPQERGFWSTLFMGPANPYGYSGENIILYPPDPFSTFKYPVWRGLVDRQKFIASEGCTDEEPAISAELSFSVGALGVLNSLIHHGTIIIGHLSAIRKNLSPTLSGRVGKRFNFRRLGRALGEMMRVMNLEFIVLRMMREVNQTDIRSLCSSLDLIGFTRQENESESHELVDDVLWQISHNYRFSRSQMKLVKESYDVLLGYQSMITAHKTQARMLSFTWVLMVLTSVLACMTFLLLPQELRIEINKVFGEIVKWLHLRLT